MLSLLAWKWGVSDTLERYKVMIPSLKMSVSQRDAKLTLFWSIFSSCLESWPESSVGSHPCEAGELEWLVISAMDPGKESGPTCTSYSLFMRTTTGGSGHQIPDHKLGLRTGPHSWASVSYVHDGPGELYFLSISSLSCFLSFYFQMSKFKKKTSPKHLESSLSLFLYMNQMTLLVGRTSEFKPSNHVRMTPFSRFSNWNVFNPGKNNMYFREPVWGFLTTYIKYIFHCEVLWVKFSPQTWVLDWIHF